MLPSSNLYSHPGRLLEDHLIGVARLSEIFWQEKNIPNQQVLRAITKVVALSHDLGKATGYFQEYLVADENVKRILRQKKETRHSLFSAVCAYFLVARQFEDNGIEFAYYPILAFEAVKRHHGNLRDIRDEVIVDDKDKDLMYRQLESISESKFHFLAQHLLHEGLPTLLTKNLLNTWINDISKELRFYKRVLRKNRGDLLHFLWLNLIYSVLIDADKSDVVLRDPVTLERKYDVIPFNLVDTFKIKKQFVSSPINNLRESAYRSALSQEVDINRKVYSINLPTGLGKTLIALSFAMKLRESVRASSNGTCVPRLIYSLPYMSVIEQNVSVIRDVLKSAEIKPQSDIILKHHHLSEVFYEKEDVGEIEGDRAKILIEGWNSEIIVTTFVQLFHTIISNRNRSLRKFHKLANSIIVLDEIQTIPTKYWLLLENIFLLLAEKFNTYIVFVTATEPLIVEESKTVKLVNSEIYFRKMDRIVMRPVLHEEMTLESLLSYVDVCKSKRYLFIFNTINCAREFYDLINNQFESVTYLSTHVIPADRLKRIEEIKKGRYDIVVATQLVEAGVDIDFDVVIRDMAPLDAINQAAGRCNRNNHAKGEVYIVSLKDRRGRKYSSYVYDPVLLDITKSILEKRDEIKEREFLELINLYYQEVKKKKSQYLSNQILEAVLKLKYDSTDAEKISISHFQLIEDQYYKRDVFIEINEEAAAIWGAYSMLSHIKNLFERKKAYDSIKADFYKYVVSVPSGLKNIPPEAGFIHYVSNSRLQEYYDKVTGFVTRYETNIIIW